MPDVVEILEERVAAAAELILSLRTKVMSLERELTTASCAADQRLPEPPPAAAAPGLAEELERLRAERAVARESIRGLLREIDRVSW